MTTTHQHIDLTQQLALSTAPYQQNMEQFQFGTLRDNWNTLSPINSFSPQRYAGAVYSLLLLFLFHVNYLLSALSITIPSHIFNSIIPFAQLIVYLVCFDLSADLKEQQAQISYWLDYMNSLLSPPSTPSSSFSSSSNTSSSSNDTPSKKWRVILVGLRYDLTNSKKQQQQPHTFQTILPSWQQTWPNLPLHGEIFITSKKDKESVQHLLDSLRSECDHILISFTKKIPNLYNCTPAFFPNSNKKLHQLFTSKT